MKSLFVILSVGALLTAVPAMAQNHDHNNKQEEHHDKSSTQHNNRDHNRHTATPSGQMNGPSQPMMRMDAHRNATQTNNRSRSESPHRGWSDHNKAADNRSRPKSSHNGWSGHNNTAQTNKSRSESSHRSWSDHNRASDNRSHSNNSHRSWPHTTNDRGRHGNATNYSHLHRNYTAHKRYRFGRYHRPRGYYTHRWIYGQRMPSAFFARNYWITNFATFGLMLPPPGTVWVRYGSDAVLIDRYTGEVIRVVYNIFY